MNEIFPEMIDRPDSGRVIAGLLYGVLCFISLPFILLLLMQGSFDNYATMGWFETVYHIINFILAIVIFRNYLGESFLNVQIDTKKFFAVCGICAGLIFLVSCIIYLFAPYVGGDRAYLLASSTLPLAEMEIFILSSDLIFLKPILGTICIVFLAPFTTSCLFYATGFAPAACHRPWLGYLLTAVLLFIPRFCNGSTHWDFTDQMLAYLCQLPIHMLSCWAYQKTDTVWAPIVTHMMVNLVASVLIIIGYVL